MICAGTQKWSLQHPRQIPPTTRLFLLQFYHPIYNLWIYKVCFGWETSVLYSVLIGRNYKVSTYEYKVHLETRQFLLVKIWVFKWRFVHKAQNTLASSIWNTMTLTVVTKENSSYPYHFEERGGSCVHIARICIDAPRITIQIVSRSLDIQLSVNFATSVVFWKTRTSAILFFFLCTDRLYYPCILSTVF